MWIDAFEELRGRRVLITGASSGIGAAVAQGFADCGASVALHYASRAAAAQSQVDDLRAQGHNALALQADLGLPGAGTALTEAAIGALGGLDILINNAGAAFVRVAIDGFDAALTQRILQLNQHAVIETIRAALPTFRAQQHGVIINTTSIAVRNGGGFGVSLYAAAKGAVEALTRTLAKEEARYGIRVNSVAPGYIDTPIHGVSSALQIERYLEATPLARAGRPEDCVGAYLFLASERLAGFITGQTLAVNGGMQLI